MIWLALPAAASTVLNIAYRVIDQFAVQWLGTEAQAAVGSLTFVLIALYGVYSLVAAGAGPLVARATGAGDADLRRSIIGHALAGGGLVGIAVLALAALVAGPITRLLGIDGATAELAKTYLHWLGFCGLPLALGPLVDAVFIAMGNTRLPMKLQALATVGNLVLNPLCIYVLDLGIGGAALATGLSRAVSVGLGLWILYKQTGPWPLVPGAQLRRIWRVGLPMTANTLMYALVYFVLMSLTIAPLGPTVIAALGIGFSALEGLTWPCFWGMSVAVASLVGRYLGAGAPGEAVRTVRLAAPLSTALGLAAALAFGFAARPLCNVFTNDPAVLEEAVIYAHVLAWSQLFVSWEALAEGVLAGSGDTRKVFLWSVPLNIARIPLAWALSVTLGMGASGIWWAINASTVCKALGKGSEVLRGGWKQVVV